jgi:uncharacterized protein with HEPN domain
MEKQDAAERRLQIIGEAIVQLPWEFKDQYPDIPWEKVAGLRNRLVHEYFDIDHKLVWNILEKSVSEFKKANRELARREASLIFFCLLPKGTDQVQNPVIKEW